jgi:adenylate cyclase
MASVMFADIQGFTRISEQLSAEEIVSGIDEYFEAFDKIVEAIGLEKIKTIGDAYLCAGGIPVPDEQHALKTATAAIEFLKVSEMLRSKRLAEGKRAFDFRIGIHSGKIVAGSGGN